MATYNKFNKSNYEDFILPRSKFSEWKVYFDGNFWGHLSPQSAGKEIPANIQFTLDHKTWYIPSVYSCSKGLIVDFCVQIPVESICDFISKWKLSPENDGSNFTNEQQMQAEAENPMTINISPEIILNGKKNSYSRGCSLSWNPCFPNLNDIESEDVLRHYNLDPAYGWIIWRAAFPWATVRKPQISSLSVSVKHDLVEVSGSRFQKSLPGERVDFIHPITNVKHTLTIQEYEQQEMPADQFGDKNYEYPAHCTVMSYTIYPDLPDDSFSIRDYNDGDRPRKKEIHTNEPQTSTDCIGIGVRVVAVSTNNSVADDKIENRAVCSALYFNPTDTVEWQIIFHEKPCADMTVKII